MSYYLRFDLFDKRISTENASQMFKDFKISCTHFGRNSLWIGESEGIIYKFDKDFGSAMFNAYKTHLSHIYQCKDLDILITCGLDGTRYDIIKFWDLSKWNKQNNPTLLRSIVSTTIGDTDFKVACFSVLNNLNAMVLGMENGTVDLIYSDVLHQRKNKRKIVYTTLEQITTIAINKKSDLLYIYLTTTNRSVILAFNEQTNDIKVTLNADEIQCQVNCSVLVNDVFVVASTKVIYDVYVDCIGPCRALDGDNISLHLYKHYLIVVKLVKPSLSSGTHLTNRSDQRSTSNYQIVMFDHINKFIAGEFTLPDFNFLFIEWGSIYAYCGSPTNKIFIFTEKDVESKLKLFFQRNSFKLAIEIAKSQNFDEDALADMYRKYGDHLYKEKRYDEAILEYIKTIGKLEPSFIIGQFYVTSQIPNLIKYMEVLVKSEFCTGEHNALLLNCYIILKENEKLIHFIKAHKTMKFDIDKIFNLLHKVHFFQEALELARKYEKHDWYLKILIEDERKYKEAIKYISELPLKETEEALLSYGNTLINIEPEVVAQQLERVCDKQNDSKLNIATILKVFVNNRKGLKHFLERYISKISSTDENCSIYVDTLLELLLYEVETEPDTSVKAADEVMEILKSDTIMYHQSKALVCCQIRGFTKGYRFLCGKQQNYLEMLNSFKMENDIDGIIDICDKFGSCQPTLWIKALEYMIEINADEKYFKTAIDAIENGTLISPLLLLEKMTVSKHSLKFGLVKDFILRYYEKNEQLILEYNKDILKYKEETKKNHDILQDLDTEVKIFQNLRCMTCSNILDIPSVHFLCGHSYHMRCFETYTKSSEQCPNCSPKIDDILLEINKWQSKMISSLADVGTLSLDNLWTNILQNNRHPIKIDPDQFLAEAFVGVSKNFNLTCKGHSESESKASIKISDKESSYIQSKEISASLRISEPRVESRSGASSVSKVMNQFMLENERKPSNPVNLIDKPIEQKRSIPIPKNPFDSINIKNSPVTAGSNKSDDLKSKNPFEDPPETKITNCIDNLNPFGDYKDSMEDYPNNFNPFE